MDERSLRWLYDKKFYIEEIDSFFIEEEKDYFKYKNNLRRKRAVEKNLEIIGEAFNRIITRDNFLAEKISKAKAIIGLRNQVIHVFDNISEENIWSILAN